MESYFSDESDFFDESDFSDDGFVQIDEAEYAALEEERRNKLTGDYYFRLYNTSIFSNPDGYRYFAINKSQIDKTNVSRSSGIPIEVMLGYHTVLPAHQKYGRVDPDTIQNFVNGHHADLATSEILKQHLLVLNTTAMVLVHIGSVLDFSKNRMVVLSTCISRTLAILFRSMYPNTSITYIANITSKVATEIKTIFHCNGYWPKKKNHNFAPKIAVCPFQFGKYKPEKTSDGTRVFCYGKPLYSLPIFPFSSCSNCKTPVKREDFGMHLKLCPKGTRSGELVVIGYQLVKRDYIAVQLPDTLRHALQLKLQFAPSKKTSLETIPQIASSKVIQQFQKELSRDNYTFLFHQNSSNESLKMRTYLARCIEAFFLLRKELVAKRVLELKPELKDGTPLSFTKAKESEFSFTIANNNATIKQYAQITARLIETLVRLYCKKKNLTGLDIPDAELTTTIKFQNSDSYIEAFALHMMGEIPNYSKDPKCPSVGCPHEWARTILGDNNAHFLSTAQAALKMLVQVYCIKGPIQYDETDIGMEESPRAVACYHENPVVLAILALIHEPQTSSISTQVLLLKRPSAVEKTFKAISQIIRFFIMYQFSVLAQGRAPNSQDIAAKKATRMAQLVSDGVIEWMQNNILYPIKNAALAIREKDNRISVSSGVAVIRNREQTVTVDIGVLLRKARELKASILQNVKELLAGYRTKANMVTCDARDSFADENILTALFKNDDLLSYYKARGMSFKKSKYEDVEKSIASYLIITNAHSRAAEFNAMQWAGYEKATFIEIENKNITFITHHSKSFAQKTKTTMTMVDKQLVQLVLLFFGVIRMAYLMLYNKVGLYLFLSPITPRSIADKLDLGITFRQLRPVHANIYHNALDGMQQKPTEDVYRQFGHSSTTFNDAYCFDPLLNTNVKSEALYSAQWRVKLAEAVVDEGSDSGHDAFSDDEEPITELLGDNIDKGSDEQAEINSLFVDEQTSSHFDSGDLETVRSNKRQVNNRERLRVSNRRKHSLAISELDNLEDLADNEDLFVPTVLDSDGDEYQREEQEEEQDDLYVISDTGRGFSDYEDIDATLVDDEVPQLPLEAHKRRAVSKPKRYKRMRV